MGYLQVGYVQVRWSVSCSDSWALGYFSFTLRSNSSQTGWGQVIVEARSSDAALHHSPLWSNSPYTAWRCVGSLSCWKTNDSPTRCKPCWLRVPWILNKSETVSPAKHPHTITPPPCFTVGTTKAEIIHSPTLRLTKTLRLEQKISNLDSSDQRTDFHRSNVHCSCFLRGWDVSVTRTRNFPDWLTFMS